MMACGLSGPERVVCPVPACGLSGPERVVCPVQACGLSGLFKA